MANRSIPDHRPGKAFGRSCSALVAALLSLSASANPYPPVWGAGTADVVNGPIHYAPVQWPTEPADPKNCGSACGQWKPYTRFQGSVNDPRVQDPSNGGTAPQNYVNVSSSCVDKAYPSAYYYLYKHPTDTTKDVIMFRWRVEQIANTYATGPSPGNFGATDPWSSGQWTVLFDVDGDGYRDLAAHLNGSSGDPSHAVDMLAGVWGSIPTQSIDYTTDPNIHMLGHNPTAFTSGSTILNFHDSLSPDTSWPNGAAETSWDYGTTRAKRVYTNSCTEYFVDYQIPVAMLDASALGGPKITRSTPISMLFCTANSLNNPFQKDCSLNRTYIGTDTKPGPFGDYLSFNKDQAYAQPIISSVAATAPAACGSGYALTAKVQDTLYVDAAGVIRPSVQAVDFYYWYDADGNGVADDAGSAWTLAAHASLKSGTLNTWTADWVSTALPRGKYLIGVQAVDNKAWHDDGVGDAPVSNRTFSYYLGSTVAATQAQIYNNGWTLDQTTMPPTWTQTGTPGWLAGQDTAFLAQAHSPAMAPAVTEDWYGNPDVTGLQIATTGIDLAINTCGAAPELVKTVSDANPAANGTVDFTITLTNHLTTSLTVNQLGDLLPPGFSFVANQGGTLAPTGSPSAGATGTLAWSFSPAAVIPTGGIATLIFRAQVTGVAGSYSNTATAATSFGSIASGPVALVVDTARLTLTKTPGSYLVNPGGSVTYTLDYANDSAVTLTGATLSDTLPTGTSYGSCSGGLSCGHSGGSPDTVTWTLGTLAGGDRGSVGLTLTVGSGYIATALTNTATISASAPDSSTITKSASSTMAVNVPQPAFTITKSVNAGATQVAPAGSVTWTINYKNYGAGAASGVVITDTLPAGFTYGSSTGGGVHSNGVVTWSIGGVAAGASGSVTVTATAAASPFTYPNPADNVANIAWTGNSTGVNADAKIGVTGNYCSAVYYFHHTNPAEANFNDLTVIRPATTNRPTGTTDNTTTVTGITVNSYNTTNQITFQSPALTSALDISGKTLTIDFDLSAVQGGTRTQVILEKISGGVTTALATSGEIQITNTNSWYAFTATMPGGTTLAVGDVLQWRFQFRASGGKDISFHYDTSTYNSRSSFCEATAPASLALTKSVDQPNIATASGTLSYVLTYANTGGTAATGVSLVDTLPANVSCSRYTASCTDWSNVPATCSSWASCSGSSVTLVSGITLNAAASGHFAVQGTVGGTASGVLTNSATLAATGLASATATAATTVGSASGGTPALSVAKSVNKTLLGPGEVATYTITVVNVGSGTASNINISDAIPANAFYTYVAGSIAGGDSRSAVGSNLGWTIGSLTAGSSATLSFQMQVAASGVDPGVATRDNLAIAADAAYCTGPAVSGCTSNTATVSISGNPNLSMTKVATPTSGLVPGGVVTYTLTVSNTGSAAATGVVVADPIPARTAFKAGSITANLGTGSFDAVNNRVVFSVGTLAAGASADLSFAATVQALLPDGTTTLANSAALSAANAPSVTASASSTAVASAALTVTKSGPASVAYPAAKLAAAAAGADVITVNSSALLGVGQLVRIGAYQATIVAIAGNTVTLDAHISGAAGDAIVGAIAYSLTYANTGNAIATNAVLTDTLPAGLGYSGATPTPSAAPAAFASGDIRWDLGALPPAASGSVQVLAFPTAAGEQTNGATLTSTETTATPASKATSVGGLSVSKRTTTPMLSAGGIADYDIVVTNSLASPVSGVDVTDALPNGFSYRSGSATVGGIASAPGFDPLDTGHLQPIWTGLTVPAGGSLTIHFQADVGTSVGAATYQNFVTLAAPTGIGVVPFDALATTAEDVTVLAAGTGSLTGHIYRDSNVSHAYEVASDTPLAGVKVTIEGAAGDCAIPGSTTCYIIHTDGSGQYLQVLPAGPWRVTVDGNSGDLTGSGMALVAGSDPATVTVPDGGQASHDLGYVLPIPDMEVSVALPGYAMPGASVSGTLTCTNLGGVTANSATCALATAGVTLGSCVQNPGATPVSTPVSLNLPAGGIIQCGFTATAPTSGSLSVTGSTSATGDVNAANDSATASTDVIDAVDDGSSNLTRSGSGTTAYALLGNDTVGATAATLGAISQSITGVTKDTLSVANPFSLDPATGELLVPNGTAAGTYAVTYRICAASMPAICDSAAKTIVVAEGASAISGTVFGDQDASKLQNGGEAGTNAGGLNVVIVDAANKVLAVAPVAADGTWATTITAGSGYGVYLTTASPIIGSTVTPTGAVPAGWAITGENASGSIDVGTNGILSSIDAWSAVSGLNFGVRQLADMRVSLSGLPATAAPGAALTGTVTCTNQGSGAAVNAGCAVTSGATVTGCTPSVPVASLAAGASISCSISATAPSSGSLTVNVATDADNDTGSTGKTASATVTVAAAATGSISGYVWYDLNHNGLRDGGEPGRSGWTVQLLKAGSLIASTSTGASGAYAFTALTPASDYTIRFVDAGGGMLSSGPMPVNGDTGGNGGNPSLSELSGINVTAGGGVLEQSLPLDPSGVVYDSVSRAPIAGATVTLSGPAGFVPATHLAGGSATATTGTTGYYQFFLLPSAPAGTYTLTVSHAGHAFVSTRIPPEAGSWPAGGGAITAIAGAPASGQPTTYYLSGPKPTSDLLNNNVPLDPVMVVSSTAIPTLSDAGLLALMLLMAGLGLASRRRRA